MGKAVLDGLVLHAGDPEPFEGFPAACLMIDQAEDEFTLSAGIGSADKALHVVTFHQGFQDIELLSRGHGYLIPPVGRQDRQIRESPFGVSFVVGLRR